MSDLHHVEVVRVGRMERVDVVRRGLGLGLPGRGENVRTVDRGGTGLGNKKLANTPTYVPLYDFQIEKHLPPGGGRTGPACCDDEFCCEGFCLRRNNVSEAPTKACENANQ